MYLIPENHRKITGTPYTAGLSQFILFCCNLCCFDALYTVLLQYVLLYSNSCSFVTILLQFTLFCRDDMIGAKYALSQALLGWFPGTFNFYWCLLLMVEPAKLMSRRGCYSANVGNRHTCESIKIASRRSRPRQSSSRLRSSRPVFQHGFPSKISSSKKAELSNCLKKKNMKMDCCGYGIWLWQTWIYNCFVERRCCIHVIDKGRETKTS